MRIQCGGGRQVQSIARGQSDAADTVATGINAAGHGQAAAIDRDIHISGAYLVADGKVAALELKAAAAEDLALVQALV
ncbi:hypothetical protein D3C77_737810 [compost metagenome]